MEQQCTAKTEGLSGSTLKLIAIVVMLIDHIGAVVLERFIVTEDTFYIVDKILRSVGRLAFPLFCFLLVEGFVYTGNRGKYALRLFIFSLVSEIPFDLAVTGKLINFNYQNVFFTLLFGFFTIYALDQFNKKQWECSSKTVKKIVSFVVTALIIAAGMTMAYFMKTDYSYAGVLAIVVMYSLRANKQISMAGGCMVLTAYVVTEVFAFFNVFLINMYNGKRGLKLKYVFYIFYPAHLLILYFIARWLGAAR